MTLTRTMSKNAIHSLDLKILREILMLKVATKAMKRTVMSMIWLIFLSRIVKHSDKKDLSYKPNYFVNKQKFNQIELFRK